MRFVDAFSYMAGMDYKALAGLLLFSLIIAQSGCASSDRAADDRVPDLEPSPSHDDSHGWGTSVQGTGTAGR